MVDYRASIVLNAADERGKPDSWLNPGRDGVFVGDIAKASFEGVNGSIARASSEAWVIGTDAAGPFIAQYQLLTSPKGLWVWIKTSWERPVPC